MADTPKHFAWAGRVGAGGLFSALAGVGGFVLWLASARRHPLVLRDGEVPILAAPALAVCAGVLASALALWLLRRLTSSRHRVAGWLRRKCGASRRRGGGALPRRWGVMFGVVAGVILAAIAVGLWLNCNFGGPERAHVSTITGMRVWVSNRGTEKSHILSVSDWREAGGYVSLYVSGEFYETRRAGERITVTTRAGLLGYECIVRVE